jgi:hypothetical protein
MSFVSVNPEAFGAAAQDLTGIGSAIKSANTTAASSTTQVAAAAEDEVSAAIAGVFGRVGQQYQALMAQAGQFHEQFVGQLNAGAGSYIDTELTNTSAIGAHPATLPPFPGPIALLAGAVALFFSPAIFHVIGTAIERVIRDIEGVNPF